jgi:hypothetical protein
VGYAVVDVAGSVFVLREERVVSFSFISKAPHSKRPKEVEAFGAYTPLGFMGTGQCIKYKST